MGSAYEDLYQSWKKKKDTTHQQYRKTNALEKGKHEGLIDFL